MSLFAVSLFAVSLFAAAVAGIASKTFDPTSARLTAAQEETMNHRSEIQRLMYAALACFLLTAPAPAPASDGIVTSAACTLRSIELEEVDHGGALLRLATDGRPTSVSTRLKTGEALVFGLSGCVLGPRLTGTNLPSGLVSELEIVHRLGEPEPVSTLVIKTGRPFSYSFSWPQDELRVLLRVEAESRISSSTAAGQKVRVMEPLPLPKEPDAAAQIARKADPE